MGSVTSITDGPAVTISAWIAAAVLAWAGHATGWGWPAGLAVCVLLFGVALPCGKPLSRHAIAAGAMLAGIGTLLVVLGLAAHSVGMAWMGLAFGAGALGFRMSEMFEWGGE